MLHLNISLACIHNIVCLVSRHEVPSTILNMQLCWYKLKYTKIAQHQEYHLAWLTMLLSIDCGWWVSLFPLSIPEFVTLGIEQPGAFSVEGSKQTADIKKPQSVTLLSVLNSTLSAPASIPWNLSKSEPQVTNSPFREGLSILIKSTQLPLTGPWSFSLTMLKYTKCPEEHLTLYRQSTLLGYVSFAAKNPGENNPDTNCPRWIWYVRIVWFWNNGVAVHTALPCSSRIVVW